MKRLVHWLPLFLTCSATVFGQNLTVSKSSVSETIKRVIANYEAMNAYDFEVQLTCPELEKEFTERMVAQFGLALPPRLVMRHGFGEKLPRVLIKLDTLPDGIREVAEKHLNSQMRPYFVLLRCLDSELVERVLRMTDAAGHVDIIEVTGQILDLELNELNEPFSGKSIKSCRVRLDLTRGTLEEIRFYLGQDQLVQCKFTTSSQQLPGGTKQFYVPTIAQVHQTAFHEGQFQAPTNLILHFEGYKFGGKINPADRAALDQDSIHVLKYKEQLRQAGLDDKCVVRSDKTLALDLRRKAIRDVALLQDMPISSLNLSGTAVTNLAALKGMPLTELMLDGTLVEDLSPLQGMHLTVLNLIGMKKLTDISALRGMPLRKLFLNDCDKLQDCSPLADCRQLEFLTLPKLCRDLRPLHGLPLNHLVINSAPITDLSPLQGMPLTTLDLRECRQVADLAPLRGMPLEDLSIYNCVVTNLSPLSGMPLKRLNMGGTKVTDLAPLVGLQLTNLHIGQTKISDLSLLRGLPLKGLRMDGTLVSDLAPLKGMLLDELNIGLTSVKDFRLLQGMPLTVLTLNGTSFDDLTLLQGLPLKTLRLGGCPVTDLRPLRGMPLKDLDLYGCPKLQDLTPLADCHQLENLSIPSTVKDIECLRSLSKLKWLGFTWIDSKPTPAVTVAEFWKEYDAKQAAGK